MKKTIISLGGSLIVPDKIDINYLIKLKEILMQFSSTHQFYIIAGGGKIARDYISAAKLLVPDIDNITLDMVGIRAGLLNSQLLFSIFKEKSYPSLITDEKKIVTSYPFIINGLYQPGGSSDNIAVKIAISQEVNEIINLTNIDYVYNKDPKKYKDASPLKEIAWSDFKKIVGSKWVAGMNAPFDPIASILAAKNKINVILANGNDLDNLKNILMDKKYFKGTLIHS